MTKKIRALGVFVLVMVWAILACFTWFTPAKAASEAERRPLAQFPELSADTLLSGKFMEKFESYTLDQFPGRDAFRRLKSLVHYNILGQKDNNGIYIVDGSAAKLEYPVNEQAVAHATQRLDYVYQTYLQPAGSKVYMAVVPDKGYYLAEPNGYPVMDYEAMFSQVEQAMPWATHVDLTDCLSESDYYRTDTHWRQEALLPVVQKLAAALGVTQPQQSDFTKKLLERPFYGVYYGQAALPMDPEQLHILENEMLRACRVYNYETQSYTDVYDMEKLTGKDLYEVFLSGAQSILRIENPNAKIDRELIVFRDSFGSSLVPLLVQDYATVTLVDIRYINSRILDRHLDFHGQDVLMLYSTLVLNNGTSLQ